jgi:sugar lactone lactonase YvrE
MGKSNGEAQQAFRNGKGLCEIQMIGTHTYKCLFRAWPKSLIVSFLALGLIIGPSVSNSHGAVLTQNQLAPSLTEIAGTRVSGFSDGPGGENRTATFNLPRGLRYDTAGNLYVADTGNNAIRKIDTTGNVTTLAGNGTAGFADGTGGRKGTATFNAPLALTIDKPGNLYVADTGNNAIRKIDTTGNVTTLAGNGKPGSVDGNISTSTRPPLFDGPNSIDIDNDQTLWITSAGRIRKIDTNGNVSTLTTSQDDNFGIALNATGVPYVIRGTSSTDLDRYFITRLGTDGSAETWDFRPPADPQGARYNQPRPFLILSLALDPRGNAFITSGYGFQKLSPNGERSQVDFDLVKQYAEIGSLQWTLALAIDDADSLTLTVGSSIVRLNNPAITALTAPELPAANGTTSPSSTTAPKSPKPKLCEAFVKLQKLQDQLDASGSDDWTLEKQSSYYQAVGKVAKQYVNAAPADIRVDWILESRAMQKVASAYVAYFKLSKAARAKRTATFTNGLLDFAFSEAHQRVADWAVSNCGITLPG